MIAREGRIIVALRVGGSLARTALFFLVASIHGTAVVGELAICSAVAAFCAPLAGGEVHNILVPRFVRASSKEERGQVLALYLHCLIPGSVLAVGAAVIIGISTRTAPVLIAIVVILAVVEQVAQDSYRLIVGLSQTLRANTLSLWRGLWWVPVAAAASYLLSAGSATVAILVLWLAGSTTTAVLTTRLVLQEASLPKTPVGWRDAFALLPTSLPFVGSSVVLSLVELIDRFVLGAFGSRRELGTYQLMRSAFAFAPMVVYFSVTEQRYGALVRVFMRETQDGIAAAVSSARRAARHSGIILVGLSTIAVIVGLLVLGQPLDGGLALTAGLLAVAALAQGIAQLENVVLSLALRGHQALLRSCVAIGLLALAVTMASRWQAPMVAVAFGTMLAQLVRAVPSSAQALESSL